MDQDMSRLTAILTLTTCGEPCWHARDEVCRCSCGGKNHGCLKTPNGVAPNRMSKIDGIPYRLKAIGNFPEVYGQARTMNREHPETFTGEWGQVQECCETSPGAYARLKPASKSQMEGWKELGAFKAGPGEYKPRPYILWTKEN